MFLLVLRFCYEKIGNVLSRSNVFLLIRNHKFIFMHTSFKLF